MSNLQSLHEKIRNLEQKNKNLTTQVKKLEQQNIRMIGK
jgi:cell division protein FtsB